MVTKLVGILNITPDSFSDGGQFFSKEQALKQTHKLLADGADIIDIGAESTRPQAKILSDEEEWSRLEQVLPAIINEIKNFNQKNNKQVQASIDSYHFSTIQKAYELGVDIINDVSGLADENIIKFIAKNNITTILMHNLAIHADPNLIVNENLNINQEIIKWTRNKINQLIKFGVQKKQLIFDPGIGFGKNAKQSILILKNITKYKILNLPIYVGHSRKSFLDSVNIEGDREGKTLEISNFLIKKEIDYLRVHDVATHNNFLRKY